jgi:hypothetical protein
VQDSYQQVFAQAPACCHEAPFNNLVDHAHRGCYTSQAFDTPAATANMTCHGSHYGSCNVDGTYVEGQPVLGASANGHFNAGGGGFGSYGPTPGAVTDFTWDKGCSGPDYGPLFLFFGSMGAVSALVGIALKFMDRKQRVLWPGVRDANAVFFKCYGRKPDGKTEQEQATRMLRNQLEAGNSAEEPLLGE